MSVDTFLQDLTDALFLLIFVLVLAKTVAQPRRGNVDAALLFGVMAAIIAEAWGAQAAHVHPGRVLNAIVGSLLMALPYLLLRLVDDFAGVAPRLMRASVAGLVASVVVIFSWSDASRPLVLTLLLVVYFVALSGYITLVIIRAARFSSGITRRRMRAVALGTLCLALVIGVAGLEVVFPHSAQGLWMAIANVLGLGCGVAYFVGFTPPGWLRRAWQEPELRSFLGRAASLPRLPQTEAIVRELEHGAASSLGTGHAVIGLWNETAGELQFQSGASPTGQPLADAIARRAFAEQRPIFSSDAARENPGDAPLYRAHNVNSVLAVPITAGDKRLGVLALYAARAPIFAEDDLALAQLLADQAAVILESRALIDEAARVQAREEATRLKDDFLSAAAHDLKTPLTAIIAQAQLLEHRARRKPEAPVDVRGIHRMIQDGARLKRLVEELLDVARVEQGKLLAVREDVDLVPLVREACEHESSPHHRCCLEAEGAAVGSYDPVRVRQLINNLLENAVKYSPDGGDVRVRIWLEQGFAHVTVTDQGIGIPEGDLPHLFDRFHRGTNVDDRRFAGMGLGLFICRGIAEQHGGRLWAASPGPGRGSTFHLVLPTTRVAPGPDSVPHEDGSLLLTASGDAS